MKKVSRDVRAVLAFRAVSSFMLIMPIMVPFLKENGLTMAEVYALQSAFSVAVSILEIPFGHLADRFGRKPVLVFGAVCEVVGFAVYSASSDFWGFFAAEMILAFTASSVSGAAPAILFDTLAEEHREGLYKKMEGRSLALSVFFEGVGSLLGGLLALASMRAPIIAQAFVGILIVILALCVHEPERKRIAKDWKESFCRVIGAFRAHPETSWVIAVSATVSASTITVVWCMQPLFAEWGVPVWTYGVLWAMMQTTTALFATIADRLEKALGIRTVFVAMATLPVLGYFILATSVSVWAFPVFVCFSFARAMNMPVSRDMVNGTVGSDVRATMLSVQTLVARLVFAVLGPIVGYICDGYSLGTGLAVAGVLYLFMNAVALSGFLRRSAM